MAKFIFVTGGVVSSLGKGIACASIGKILEARGIKVALVKCDPYINVDPGTMNPFQHGEVYVTDDGAETDLDLGIMSVLPMPSCREITISPQARSISLLSPKSAAEIIWVRPSRSCRISQMR